MATLNLYKLETPGPVTVMAPGIGSVRVSCKDCDSEIIHGIAATDRGQVIEHFCEDHLPETDAVGRLKDGPNVLVYRI